MRIELGDWVQGNTSESAFIHGFVKSVDPMSDAVGIYVVASDRETAVGQTVGVSAKWVKKLPDHTPDQEEALRSMIDVALLANDEQWFRELTDKLNALRKTGAEKEGAEKDLPLTFGYNRISGVFGSQRNRRI